MKALRKNSKFFMFLLDIIVITVSAIAANLLLCNKEYILSNENIKIIVNSIISAIIVYQIYLNLFKTYRHITRFENGTDYLVYIIII